MPSVVMNEGRLNRVRISPLTVPITAHTSERAEQREQQRYAVVVER